MTEKNHKDQAVARRNPQQARSQHKVELILEAASRLLDEGDVASLKTNAVAELAGVSIGTLYQYFKDKQAILDALMRRELDGLAAKAMRSLTGPPPEAPGERVRLLVQAVLGAYGGRKRVHRRLMEHALIKGTGKRLNPMFKDITTMLSSQGIVGGDRVVAPMTPAQAFVLTHAVTGVLHGLVAASDSPAKRADIEDALVRLVLGFVGGDSSAPAVRKP
ncbi:TetR/AcrR family transcriptional regulator [Variovorax sp. J22R133]|uniref:TetR/AcrR family transcriptional regulator n=1 Tax=Variovorax brevis TaxID=3053503 RepID=UPI0025779500|nr:TetR/AcrR family transcriptional regulator [Variovorax sp. J22R133]MDM0115428.1 TetR/AcrR family transcriptional regulator [Variovorax sp. J22R133]